MKKSIFLFFAAILCSVSAWAGPTFKGGCVYFHNKGGWNDSYKYICISHDSWTEPRSVTVITNTQLWYNALPTSGWTDAKYMSAMGHSSSKSASNFKVSSCNHYTKNVSLGDWGFNSGNAQMLTPANGNNNAALELTYMGNSYSSMNRTITVKAKVSTDNGSSFAEATSPGTLSASSFAFTSYTSCNSAQTLSSGKITCGYTANTSLTAADADGYTFAGWYDASGNKQTEELTLSLNPTADATYYAYFKANQYTVKFDSNEGTGTMSDQSYTYDIEQALTANAFTRTGYTFEGWNTQADGTGTSYTDKQSVSNLSSTDGETITLYAQWAEIPANNHNITYTAQATGWTYGAQPTSAEEGATVTFEVNPTTGYTVTVTSSPDVSLSNNGNTYTFTMPTTDVAIDVTATENTHDVTISYKCGDQTIQDDETVNAVGEITAKEITAPEITGYKFTSWTLGNGITNKSANTTTNPISVITNASGTYTLTANYEKVVTVYFVNSSKWSTVTCHHWVSKDNKAGTTWPGDKLTKTGETVNEFDVYKATFTNAHTMCIFNNNGAGQQTGDLEVQDGKYYYPLKNQWYASLNDIPAIDPLATEVYLAGDMNGWSTIENEFRKAAKGDGTASIILNLTAGTYKFKVVDNGSWLGNNGTIDKTISGWTFEDGKNDCPLKATIAGDYTFTWAISTKKLSVTYPTICAITATANDAAMGTIAGAGDYGKGSTATLTATPNDGYLFVNWTKGGEVVATTQEYSFKVTEAVELVANFEAAPEEVHNVTVSYVCGGNKIAEDQTVAAVGVTTPKTTEAPAIFGYTFTSWTLGADVTSTNELTSNTIDINIVAGGSDFTLTANYTEIPKVTIYVVNNTKWNKVYAYGWGGSVGENPAWPGTEITANKESEKIAGFDVHSYSVVPGSYVNIKFTNGSGDESANFKWTDGKYYYMDAANEYAGGTAEEVEKALVGVFTIMGASELGLSWDLTKTGNDMTKQADGTYTLVKEGLDLATTGNYEYKVVKNHSWDWSIPSGNTNQTLKVDKDGTYTVTFTLSADKTKLTADAECTAEKEVILDCFVAGTTNLVGGTADFTDKLAMTYDEGTKTYSKTFTALATGNYQMKVVYGSDWLGYDKLTTPVPANVTEGDDKKIKFSLAEAGDVTVTYNVEKGIGLTGNFATPIPPVVTYQLKGVGGWEQPGIELVQNPGNNKEYMLTCQAISATDAIKVVRLEDGVIKDYYGNGTVKDGVEVTVNYDGDGNITLPAGTYNFYFDTNEPDKKLWIAAATDCVTEPETYTRNTTIGNYGTICLPYGSSQISGAEFYEVAGKEIGKVVLDQVTTLEAGMPYIFKATANELKVVYEGEEKEARNKNGLYGTLVNNVHVAEGNYIIFNNELRKCGTGCYVNENRAYLVLSEVPSSVPAQMPGRKRVGMAVTGENGTTDLDNLVAPNDKAIKVLHNGQIIIIRNGEKFNAQGQKL